MNTSEFTKLYGENMNELKEQCLCLEDGCACYDGAKCEVKVSGFKDAEEFVKNNSAFFVKDLNYVLGSFKKDNYDDFKLRLVVTNCDEDKNPTWEADIVYADCWNIPYCDSREHIFGKDYLVNDGFVVFDKVRIRDFKVIEKPVVAEEPKKETVAVADAPKSFLDDLIKEFNDAKGGKDCKSFCKSFSYSVDGNGNVKASQNINGEKKNYEFNLNGETPVEKLNRLAD